MSVDEVGHVLGFGVMPAREGVEPHVTCVCGVNNTGKLDGEQSQVSVAWSVFVPRGQAPPTKGVGKAPAANNGCSGAGGSEEGGPCLGMVSSLAEVAEQASCEWLERGGLK